MARIAFIDIEASGLGSASYPIEIAWALSTGGPPVDMLIRPEPDWTYWEKTAESLHGIPRERLMAEGLPVPDVVARMRTALDGIPLYAEHAEDHGWLRRLLEAAGTDWTPALHTARPLLEAQAARNFRDLSALRWEINRRIPIAHRAGADAQRLRDLYRAASRRT